MKTRFRAIAHIVPAIAAGVVCLLAAPAQAQTEPHPLAIGNALDAGPDVIVGDLHEVFRWATIGDTTAYSVGTVSCNVGDIPLKWIANTHEHPVIGQNMFRLKDGIFEQVGQSWLKHGFTALQQNLCGACIRHPNGTALGVNCSDPYSASLNGSHTTNRLGPKFQVNAATGLFTYPPFQSTISNALSRRLQVRNTDVSPALNPNTLYVVEGQYVTLDDTAFGNGANNASYRQVFVTGASLDLSFNRQSPPFVSQTRRELPAIYAWQEFDPEVDVQIIDIPGDGRMLVAHRVTDLGGGNWKYVYAVQNLTSDRSGASLTFPKITSATVTNTYFRDVDYHSGEPFDNTDWVRTEGDNFVAWTSPETFAQNANTNALRWGTMYTFAFESNTGPNPNAIATIGLFKPGTPDSIEVPVPSPGCWADCDTSTGHGVMDIFDFLCFGNKFDQGDSYACDCDISTGPGVCDVFDFLCFGNAFAAGCD